MMSTATPFPHRRNPDGSYDSICTTCFSTVARYKREHELLQLEEAHIAERDQFSRAESAIRLSLL
jgi:hypothetical protein